MTLDISFEADAAHYHVNKRMWVCVFGHRRVEIVDRGEPPLRRLEARKCRRCGQPLSEFDLRSTHPVCYGKEKARKKRGRQKFPKKPCRTCRVVFQPTTTSAKDCPKCRKLSWCELCEKRHAADGRHLVKNMKWTSRSRMAILKGTV
jgi:hypothetical protein